MNSDQSYLATPINKLTKYVRVRSDADSRFVMFDFAIGDPTLFVELVLPPKSFEEFCAINNVVYMTDEQMALNDAEEDKWRYGQEPTLVGSNHTDMTATKTHS